MKKFLAVLFAAVMLTACESSAKVTPDALAEEASEGTTEVVTETTAETTTVTTTEVTTTTTKATTTAAPTAEDYLTLRTEDELSGYAESFLSKTNKVRRDKGLDELIYADELEECAVRIADKKFSDKNDECEAFFAENGISGVTYDHSSGMFMYYNDKPISAIVNFYETRDRIEDPFWKYVGFYYDSYNMEWQVVYLTDVYTPQETTQVQDGSDEIQIYFDNSSRTETLFTYMRALAADDYSAYLAITLNSDSEEIREQYESDKENYVGVDVNDILYYQTEINELYGYADTTYKVVEFDSDGNYLMDWETFGEAYGVVRLKKNPDGGFYVSAHLRYSPLWKWQ